MDDWTIHDRTEFPVQKVTTITKLKWGVNFTVKHGAGIPAELLRVEVDVLPTPDRRESPLRSRHTEQDGFTQYPVPQQLTHFAAMSRALSSVICSLTAIFAAELGNRNTCLL